MPRRPWAASTFWTGVIVGAVGLAAFVAGIILTAGWILGGGCGVG